MGKTVDFSGISKLLTAFAAAVLVFLFTGLYASADSPRAELKDVEDVLTSSEESKILEEMEKTAKKVGFSIGIVITDDLGELNDEQYADAFGYDSFGYGDWAVLLLLNTHGNPKYYYYEDQLMFNGRAYDKLTDDIDRMWDKIYNNLGDYEPYDFYSGCMGYIKAVKTYGSNGFGAFMVRLTEFTMDNLPIFGFVLAICIVVTVSVYKGITSGYKKKRPISAATYLQRNRTRIITREDIFLREYTTSVHHSSSSGGGRSGGGGGGHHGGGGGRHR